MPSSPPRPLPPDVRGAISSLFASTRAEDDGLAYISLSAAACAPGAAPLLRELAARELRVRLFLHVSSAAGSSRTLPPDALLALLRVTRAVCAYSRVASSQLSGDVGVRPLVACLQRTARGAQPPATLEAAAVACELLGIIVDDNPARAAVMLRLESGVDAVCALLTPLPQPPLLYAASALLHSLCVGSSANVRLAHRRGVLVAVTAGITAAVASGCGDACVGTVRSLLPLLGELLSISSTEGGGGSRAELLTLALSVCAGPIALRHRDVAGAALSVLAGAATATTPVDVKTLMERDGGGARCAATVWALVHAHGGGADLLRRAVVAASRIASALQQWPQQLQSSPPPSPLSGGGAWAASGYSAITTQMAAEGTPFVACGHLALVASSVPTGAQTSPPALFPAHALPPATLALWPLPATYAFWSPCSLASTVTSLPPWAGAFLPRAGFWPGTAALESVAATVTPPYVPGGAAAMPSTPPLPARQDLLSLASGWLHAPHWFPELQKAASVLPELAEALRDWRKGSQSYDVSMASACVTTAGGLLRRGSSEGGPGAARAPLHPAVRISAIKLDEPTLRLQQQQPQSLGAMSMSAVVSLCGGGAAVGLPSPFPFDAAAAFSRAVPLSMPLPPALHSNLSAAASTAVLGSGGNELPPAASLRLPRVCLPRGGIRSVRPWVVPPSSIPSVVHSEVPPLGELGHPHEGAISSEELLSFDSRGATYVLRLQPQQRQGMDALVELPEPLLPEVATSPHPSVIAALTRQAARACALVASLSGSTPCTPLHRHLVYYRHTSRAEEEEEEGSEDGAVLPSALLLLGATTRTLRKQQRLASPIALPLPPTALGVVQRVSSRSASSDIAEGDFATACDGMSVAEALALPSGVTLMSPRDMRLLEDGPPASASGKGGEDGGAGSGGEEEEGDDEDVTAVAVAAPAPASVVAAAALARPPSRSDSIASRSDSVISTLSGAGGEDATDTGGSSSSFSGDASPLPFSPVAIRR